MNYDDWKLASPPEGGEVSSCCGSDYEDLEIMGELIYKCHKCNDLFDQPEDESEYNERMRENALEEREEARRKYNE